MREQLHDGVQGVLELCEKDEHMGRAKACGGARQGAAKSCIRAAGSLGHGPPCRAVHAAAGLWNGTEHLQAPAAGGHDRPHCKVHMHGAEQMHTNAHWKCSYLFRPGCAFQTRRIQVLMCHG